MTEFITGKRGSGKTSELIKRSYETGAYILTQTENQANYIIMQARQMGLTIQRPVTILQLQSLQAGRRCSRTEEKDLIYEKGVMIDELDLLFGQIFPRIPIHAATITDRHNITVLRDPNDFVVKEDVKSE